MTDILLQEDKDNRQRALDIASFIVEAPAGAGKTELLTQRFLRLLETVDEPEEIIAITFTRKAAGEMRQRIQESLHAAHAGVLPDAEHKRMTFDLACKALARSAERGWQLETQPGRLRLTTIDALCASLARQMPLLSRFGAQPSVAEDARRHYDEAARRALDHLEDNDVHAQNIAIALGYLDNDVTRLARLLADMLARREQWREIAQLEQPETAIEDAVCALVNEELALIAMTLSDAWQNRLMPLARFAAAQLTQSGENQAMQIQRLLDWAEPLSPEVTQLDAWRALADLLLTQKNELRKTVRVNEGFPPGKEFKAQKDAMLAFLAEVDSSAVIALQRIRDLPRVGNSAGNADGHSQYDIIKALVGLMKLAAAELWLVFRENGEVDFGELSARAISALGDEFDPTELGLRLDYRIRHLLVDEFQDTSPMQIELLKRLTAGWQMDDGRTLFAVGDPMQSIYRFRKADVGLFLGVAKTGIGRLSLTPLRLSRNNRSCPAVVGWINAHFPQVFPAADEPLRGEITYRPFVATRENLPEAGVSVHLVAVDQAADGQTVARREAQKVIALIREEWRQDPQRQIAVLVRARDHLTALVTALRQQTDWHFSAVDIEPLVGRQIVQDLIALTRALHHRGDRLNWLAILRAPWCGLTLADLFALAGDDHVATIWSLMNDASRVARLSADGQLRVQFMRSVLHEALAGQGRQRRRVWVEHVWRQLGGPQCLMCGSSQKSMLQDAHAFFNRLDALDATGRFSVDSLEDDMAALFAAVDAAADGRLQLMTIHKSKGLEFDTVILPGLHKKSSMRDAPLLAWDTFALSSGERLVAAPVNTRRANKAEPTVYGFLQKLEEERKSNEEARVLYVAATRAVRRLHLVGGVWEAKERAADKGEFAPPLAGTPLARLWPVLTAASPPGGEGARSAANQDDGARTSDWAIDLATFVPRLIRQKNLPARTPKADLSALLFSPLAAPDVTDIFAAGTTTDALAAAIGTLTHAFLEQMAGQVDRWDEARLNGLQPVAASWLASRGWSSADAGHGAARVVRMLHTTVISEAGRWLLATHENAGAELALSKVGVGDTLHGASTLGAENLLGTIATTETRVIDRTFIDNGVRWIIDYKTADLGAQASDREFAAHAERFRAQLENYSALFHEEGLPLQLAIFYVAHGKLVPLEQGFSHASD